jgi:hypothetical protein
MTGSFAVKSFTISGVDVTALSLDLNEGRKLGAELYEGAPLD